MDEDEFKIQDLRRIKLAPDDTLVIRAAESHPWTDEIVRRLRDELREAGITNRVFLCEADVTIEVLEATK